MFVFTQIAELVSLEKHNYVSHFGILVYGFETGGLQTSLFYTC
jgi:hypothetical protein